MAVLSAHTLNGSPSGAPDEHSHLLAPASSGDEGVLRRSHWTHTCCLLVASVLGIGVLGLPLAFVQLGQVWGLIALLLFGTGSVYSGVLINRLTMAAGRGAASYADLGHAAYGAAGRWVVRAVSFGYLFGTCASMQLTAAIALVELVRDVAGHRLCLVTAGIVVVCLLLPLLQVRTLHALAFLAAAGVLCILVPAGIVVAELSALPARARLANSTGQYHAGNGTAAAGNGASAGGGAVALTAVSPGFAAGTGVANIIFAFAGQVLFVELQSEMAAPADFPRAVWWASATCLGVYVTVALVGYAFAQRVGVASAIRAPITASLPRDTASERAASAAANALLLAHVLVAYVINANVVNRAVVRGLCARRRDGARGIAPRRAGWLPWLMVSTATVASWYVVANSIPFLQDLMGFIGATLGVVLTYVFPTVFARKVLWTRLSLCERRATSVVLFVAVACSIFATASVVANTAQHFAGATGRLAPFTCSGQGHTAA